MRKEIKKSCKIISDSLATISMEACMMNESIIKAKQDQHPSGQSLIHFAEALTGMAMQFSQIVDDIARKI